MINVLDGVFSGVDKLESIVNSIEFDNIYVFGNLTKLSNNHTVIPRNDIPIIPILLKRDSSLGLTSEGYESVLHNICKDYSENELQDRYVLLGNSLDDLQELSFLINKNTEKKIKKIILNEWIKVLRSRTHEVNINLFGDDIPENITKEDLVYEMNFSISILEFDDSLDLIIIEGCGPFKGDVEGRHYVLNNLYPEDELNIISIKKKYESILKSHNIEFLPNIEMVNSMELIENKLKNILPNNIFKKHKYLHAYNKDILFLEILLHYFLLDTDLPINKNVIKNIPKPNL